MIGIAVKYRTIVAGTFCRNSLLNVLLLNVYFCGAFQFISHAIDIAIVGLWKEQVELFFDLITKEYYRFSSNFTQEGSALLTEKQHKEDTLAHLFRV